MGRPKRTNQKAQAARDRKEAVKTEKDARASKAREEAQWADEGTKAQRAKAKRAAEQRNKSEAAAARRREAKELEQRELETIKQENKGRVQPKVTRAEIEARRRREAEERERQLEEERRQQSGLVFQDPDAPLEENVNRTFGAIQAAVARGDAVSASGVDEALGQLTVQDEAGSVDKHPEKRAKAAFKAYEESRLPELRAENPSLRLTQVKEMLWKEWQSSPENPLVQQRQRDLGTSLG